MFKRGRKRKNAEDADDSSEEESDWRDVDNGKRCIKHITMLALEKEVMTDFTFEVGPTSIPFKVHKLILALASPVFEAMFFGPEAKEVDKVAVPDLFGDGFDNMLRFIYGDVNLFEHEQAAFETWFAADEYCLDGLKDICEAFLNNCDLEPNNIWLMLKNSVFFNRTSLTNKCLEYMRSRMESSLRLPGFLDADADTLQQVLSMDQIEITELELLRALMRWAKHKVENGEAESNLKAVTPVLEYIRFGAMSSVEFSIFMSECENIISPKDAVAIYMHLSNPTCFKLPDWCSPKTSLRSSEPIQDEENSSNLSSDNKNTDPFRIKSVGRNILKYIY